MKKSEREEKALKLISRLSEIDDKLGTFSDYEGDREGPTWDAWSRRYFIRRAKEALQLHGQAMMLWGKLRKLYRTR